LKAAKIWYILNYNVVIRGLLNVAWLALISVIVIGDVLIVMVTWSVAFTCKFRGAT
jgi:hypothetical protein